MSGACDWLSMGPVHTSPERIAQESCASSGPFQVRIQPKILTEFGPETMNGDTLDPCCEPLRAAVWTKPKGPKGPLRKLNFLPVIEFIIVHYHFGGFKYGEYSLCKKQDHIKNKNDNRNKKITMRLPGHLSAAPLLLCALGPPFPSRNVERCFYGCSNGHRGV